MNDGQMLGRYRIIEILGRGGFAAVYRAENTSLGIEVALKIMDQSLAQDERFVTRFRQEARETARLDHPNIVRVLDLNQVDGQLFIAMEYVPGRDLNQLLGAGGPLLPVKQIVNIVNQVAAALDYAHERNLVHRDVKPQNILIRPDGGVKLVDFGIVKAAEGTRLTRTGTLIGTPAYMSPEQIKGLEVGPGSDIYSLGIVTYELVTGRIPFDGDTASLGYKHVHEPPPLPSSISPRAGGPIESVLLRALEKSPADRFESAGAFAAALQQAVEDWQSEALLKQYQQAQQYLAARNYASAIKALDSLQALAPGYQDVEALLIQARAGLDLGRLYQEAGEHLHTARELAAQVQAADPGFPDNQLVFQTLKSTPALQELPTVVEGRPSGAKVQDNMVEAGKTAKTNPAVTALRWSGLALALLAFNGMWKIGRQSVWGINTWLQDALYPYVFVPLLFVAGYIALLLLQRFVPRFALLWYLLRSGWAWLGAILMLVTLFTVYENISTGPAMAALGLFLAGSSDLLALIGKRNEA